MLNYYLVLKQYQMIISVINNTWKSTIVVTGMSGFPEAEIAGNVLRKSTSCRILIKTPTTLFKEKAKKIIEKF